MRDMARVRKKPGQQPLVFSKRGGARPGAGRPRKGKRASEPHKRRPVVKPSEPVHVTLRTVEGLPRLRTRSAYKAVREATIAVLGRENCRIVHLSIQRNHVHLLVEADDRMALARGMQAFQISAAKHINAALGRRRGQVFADRYHPERITNRKQARHALAYVLNNWRRHREDRAAFAQGWLVDPFSSGCAFDGWKELEGSPWFWKLRETYQPMPVWRPKSWLLSEGWRMYGLIGAREVPGPRV
jgi:REP element-mobilizing transposase RayT